MREIIAEFILKKTYDLNGPITLRVANIQNILKQKDIKIMRIISEHNLFNLSITINVTTDDRIKCIFYADKYNSKITPDEGKENKDLINSLIDSFKDVFELEENVFNQFEFKEEIPSLIKEELCNKLMEYYKAENKYDYIEQS